MWLNNIYSKLYTFLSNSTLNNIYYTSQTSQMQTWISGCAYIQPDTLSIIMTENKNDLKL